MPRSIPAIREPTVMTLLCRLADLQATGSRGFAVGEGDWPLRGFVVRLPDGTVRAWVNRCPHARHPLDLLPDRFMTPEGDLIRCSSHGALFLPESGLCVAGPCVGKSLQALSVALVGDEIRLVAEAPASDNSALR